MLDHIGCTTEKGAIGCRPVGKRGRWCADETIVCFGGGGGGGGCKELISIGTARGKDPILR